MYIKFGSVEAGGFDNPLLIEGFTPPSPDLRTNYIDRPNADGQLVGKTFLGSATMGFDLVTNTKNLKEAYALANQLERDWTSTKMRVDSNVSVPLSYSLDGSKWYRVYGRPGKFTGFAPDVLATQGVGRITVDFTVTRFEHFSEIGQVETITYLPPIQGGLVAPLTAPITTVGTGVERSGFVTNKGDLQSPLEIRFFGPISNPSLRSSSGWEVSYRGTIPVGDFVTINPLQGTVKQRNGSSVAGNLGTKVRLSRVNLPVGKSELFLKGTDTTGTSKVELRWRDAHTGVQY